MSRKARKKQALSRFFLDNSVVKKISIKRLVISPYFFNKKTKQRKNHEPPFKGFSKESINNSQAPVRQINFIVEKISDTLKENDKFLGFSKEDIQHSSNLCVKIEKLFKNLEETSRAEDFLGFTNKEIQNCGFVNKKIHKNLEETSKAEDFLGFTNEEIQSCGFVNEKIHKNLQETSKAEDFLGFTNKEIQSCGFVSQKIHKIIKNCEEITGFTGFSLQDQKDAVAHLTKSLHVCDLIRNYILRKIDRRVLKTVLKDSKNVHSRFFSKGKLKTLGALKSCQERKFFGCTKCEIKMEIIKKEEEKFDIKKDLRFGNKALKPELKIHNSLCVQHASVFPESPFFQIKKDLIIPTFIPPKSPHYLIEEELYHDPWALLVATIFLNKTSCGAARPYVFWFLDENPDPFAVISKREEELETYFGALGLQKTRANQVWRMSHDFIYKKWKRVSELYGIGRYAEDAFRMFCLGDFSINPQDRYLKIYKAWYEMEEKKARQLQMNS